MLSLRKLNRRSVAASVVAVGGLTISLYGQGDSLLISLRQAGIPEAPGPIPVFYVGPERERALGFQKSLQTGRDWFEKQLNVTVPVALTVFDTPTYDKFRLGPVPSGAGRPPRNGDPWIVMMTALGAATPDGQSLNALGGEGVLFHEYGHILAGQLGIGSRSDFMNELFADIFWAAHIQSERPDLLASFEAPRPGGRPTPRYTALIDWDYLGGMGGRLDAPSAGGLQREMNFIALAITKSQRLSDLVLRLQKEFPATTAKSEGLDEITGRLSRISPGFQAASFATLYGPTTLTRAKLVPCDFTPSPAGRSGHLVVVNATPNPIRMTSINHPRGASVNIAPNQFIPDRTSPVGGLIKMSDDSCYVIGDEPTVVIVGPR